MNIHSAILTEIESILFKVNSCKENKASAELTRSIKECIENATDENIYNLYTDLVAFNIMSKNTTFLEIEKKLEPIVIQIEKKGEFDWQKVVKAQEQSKDALVLETIMFTCKSKNFRYSDFLDRSLYSKETLDIERDIINVYASDRVKIMYKNRLIGAYTE